MVGMDDRVETRGMTVTKENQVVGEPREREREKKRGLDRIRGGIFQHIYMCVCVYIYIYFICARGRKRRERSGDNGCARVYTRMSGVSRIYAYSGLVM